RAHFDGLLPLALTAAGVPFEQDEAGLRPRPAPEWRKRVLRWWGRRRRAGKGLNVVRLMKGTTTFEGAARYAAWKVQRETGIAVEVSPWAERHPIVAAPRLLGRLRRARRTRGPASD